MLLSSTLKNKTLDFVARNRFSLPTVCCCIAFGCFVYQAELVPPPEGAIEIHDVRANTVGILEVQVLGRRDNVVVAKREAGFGIEFTSHNDTNGNGSPGRQRLAFAHELLITPGEVLWIRGHGPNYRLGVLNRTIVSVASQNQPLIKYERYQLAARRVRGKVILFAALLPAIGLGLFAIGHRHHARTAA